MEYERNGLRRTIAGIVRMTGAITYSAAWFINIREENVL